MEAVLTADQMRKADSITIERLAGNGLLLMEHASSACVRELFRRFGSGLKQMKVLILAGRGNNGGDGMAIARQLHSKGVSVSVIVPGNLKKISAAAAFQLSLLKNFNLSIENPVNEFSDETILKIRSSDLIVDAMLGTGLKSAPRGIVADAIEILAEYNGFVFAVDVPSGLNSDSGAIPGQAVRANVTVTFGKMKRCHALSPSCLYCGEVIVDDITIPDEVFEEVDSNCFLVERDDVVSRLKIPQADAHKGTFGHVFVAGGMPGKLGASVLAGRAALLSGSGLVSILLSPENYTVIGPMAPELMVSLYNDPYDEASLLQALKGKDVILAGPGFGITDSARGNMEKLLSVFRGKVLLDADVFRLFKVNELAGILDGRPAILTPHPGEMAAFHGISIAEVQQDRVKFAVETAVQTGTVTVLKGYRTVIGCPDGKAFVNPTGNTGLATAGSGDVLSGIAASFLGQGMSPVDAAVSAVYIHGLAGDLAADELTARGVTAPAILKGISAALKSLVGTRQ